MFYITAEVYIFGVIIYLLLGSGDLQPWAKGDYQQMTDNDNNHEDNKPEVDANSVNNTS